MEDDETESADSFLRALARAPAKSPDPERIGRFRVLGRLGAGGMGVVYRAEDEGLRRDVAIKVLPTDLQGDAERRKRLLREARAAAAVTHPNLAAVYEVGEAEGRVYIAMEIAPGQSLRARLDRGRLSAAETHAIAAQIAKGLARAHAAGIVHRDLKPENVMVAEDGGVKILDFGLAKIHAKDDTVTLEGHVMGTPAYMAPEQARGLDVTPAADVYAFGVMLHEMLTGHRPEREDARSPLVSRCLAVRAGDRPADGAALVTALETTPRRRWWPAAIALFVAAAAGLFVARPHPTPAVPVVDAGAPAPSVTTYMDFPPPKTQNAQAAAEYTAAMQAFRDDSWMLAQLRLQRVVELDPTIAIAHLRLAIALWGNKDDGATSRHMEYSRALALRGQLDERDQAVATALEPVLQRARESRGEAGDRMAKLHERWPRDLEILMLLAFLKNSDPVLELALADEGHRLDPKDGNFLEARGRALSQLDRNDEARVAWEEAVALAVTATDGFHYLAEIDEGDGKCLELERHARTFAERNLTPDVDLLDAIVANGGSDESFHQVLAQMVSRMPAPLAKFNEALMNGRLALAHGDFVESRRLGMEAEAMLLSDHDRAQSIDLRVGPTDLLLATAIETGDDDGAVRAAKRLISASSELFGSFDATRLMYIRRIAAGKDPLAIAAFEKERDAVVEQALLSKSLTPIDIWYASYAAPVFLPAEANAALAVVPRFGTFGNQTHGMRDLLLGRLFFLAGRGDEALPHLTRAVASCSRLEQPWGHAEAAVALGDLLAAKGDHDGACAAYGKILSYWGNAKPRSTHAEKARAGRAALRCAD